VDSIENLKAIKDKIKDELYIVAEIKNENIYSKSEIVRLNFNSMGINYLIDYEKLVIENLQETVNLLKAILESKNIKKIVHDCKPLLKVLRKNEINIENFTFDTKIAAYLIDSTKSEYLLKDLIKEILNIHIDADSEFLKVKEVNYLKAIYENLNKKIEELNMGELFYQVEMPLVNVLAAMELRGFKVNREKLVELGDNFSIEIQNTQSQIYEFADEQFNISSPKQLGKVLFEKLDLPVIKKTKTGYSTNAEVLEKLKDKHPIIEKIMYYRQLTKLYSTYIEGLKAVIDTDGNIHSTFNQAVTTTGRLSSTEPNLQNIPIKYEMGRNIRKVFIPDNEDSVIMSADYSQIELRVLAHIAKDDNLINAFKEHSDIHTKTASEVFKVPVDKVTPLMRSNAKAVNFGIVYGIGDFSLAQDLNISRKEAKEYIETYLTRYPMVKKYLEDIVVNTKKEGYVKTILNRRRYIQEINANNKIVAAFGERLAMNTPIQGSAADIIKLAMVKVYEKLQSMDLRSTIILQVHDELILNVFKDELELVKSVVKEEMENAILLLVPLEVDINIGANWYEAK
jgi:DNA polymerase-1